MFWKKFVSVFLICVLLFSMFPNLNKVKAEGGTVVSGPILSDTVWTKQNSPYIISDKVQVAENATLTIEAGVEVQGGTIELWGNFIAAGTKEAPVILKKTRMAEASTNRETVQIELDYVFAKEIYLANNSNDGILKISNSQFEDSYLYADTTSYITNNLFVKGYFYFINDFYNKLMSVQDNSFFQSNLYYQNAFWVFENNNLYSSTLRVSDMSPASTVYAQSNYWGSTDSKEIDKMIIDRNDDLNLLGYVDYSNYLTQPNISAPDTNNLTKEPSVSVEELTDKSSQLKGKINDDINPLFTKIEIYYPGVPYEILPVDKDGTFTIKFLEYLRGGIDFTLRISYFGLPFKDIALTVKDTTPPKSPEVYEVTDQQTQVAGVAEENTTVLIKNDLVDLGSAVANEHGNFVVDIPQQQAGSILSVIATDHSGNHSLPTKVTVIDVTAPSISIIGEVNDRSTTVTGITEAGSTIIIESGMIEIGKGVADSKGEFSITIPKQKGGTNLIVKAIDRAGNRNEGIAVTIVDRTAPNVPDVYPVLENDSYVYGMAEIDSKIEVKVNGILLGTGEAGSYGYFYVAIPGQKPGTELEVTATDKAGNVSEIVKTVVYDITPPGKPIVNEVTDQDLVITGQVEPGSYVEVKVNKNVIGTATSEKDGMFSVTIPAQKAGTILVITATDKNLNVSEAETVVVKDITAPAKPFVDEVTDQTTAVTGQAEADSSIEMKVKGSVVGKGVAGAEGKFTITISAQNAGTELDFTATDKAGNVSEVTTVVVKDLTAPAKPEVNEITDQTTTVTGQAEAGSMVEVKVNSSVIGRGTAGIDGKFTIEITRQEAGTELMITAKDKAENVSEAVMVVVKDVTAPSKPSITEVTDQDSTVVGQTEVGAKVEVRANGNLIGTGITGVDERFVIPIPVQKAGTKIEVTATDKAGNVSEITNVIVKDITAPMRPIVNDVTDKDTKVTGQAEAGSDLNVSVNGKVIGTGAVNNEGEFSITIPAQAAETILEIRATDKAGNNSDICVVTVIDGISPVAPTVAEVTDRETVVRGTAEPHSTVIAKSFGAEIGRSVSDGSGKFSITIPKQTAGKVIEVYAVDNAGNESTAAKITVQNKLVSLVGDTRYATAVKVAQIGWKTADTVLLVNGFSIVDGLTATPLASAKDAPILLTATDSIPQQTWNEITRLRAKEIILIGGTSVISPKVEKELVAKGYKVTRIGGANRKDTSLLIAKELDKLVDASMVYVAYGFGEPDALSIAAQAGLKKQPIILADKTSVPTDTMAWLKTEDLTDAYFIGGESVIGPGIINEMDKIISRNVQANRISGLSRHETNAKVISKFYPEGELTSILLAKSETESLVDALAAGPLAAKLGSPVLLISSSYGILSSQKQVLAGKHAKYVHQIGGGVNPSAVSEMVQ
ncbi:putative cell wall-binding protein/flagellar motor switch/type III secretory pathway protein FliN [Bacillus niacini]|uniref:Cell wall-binding protein/flagellar motor switch/type III secretory pathway protein FliN n=1 Tax=Neobacillus niacini TaxID=86668 RepID=A0A852TAS6_9BACI|nr:Ig-like domain-containing protein [Neobacillus niacini]NYE05880.1 putative cell wall-binding protein/flagellar motor switch/type III secretory pathway protein FliN [Neobacillus niacini]